jgi:hypothetical protein
MAMANAEMFYRGFKRTSADFDFFAVQGPVFAAIRVYPRQEFPVNASYAAGISASPRAGGASKSVNACSAQIFQTRPHRIGGHSR